MNSKTFAIITDVHSNSAALEKGLSIIDERAGVDKTIFLGDYFSLGPDPNTILKILQSDKDSIIIKGNHERYLVEKIWNDENPELEGMSQDDPILKEIIENEAKNADLIIGAVLIAGAKAPKLISKEMLKSLKPGCVMIDIAIDQVGCFEIGRAHV